MGYLNFKFYPDLKELPRQFSIASKRLFLMPIMLEWERYSFLRLKKSDDQGKLEEFMRYKLLPVYQKQDDELEKSFRRFDDDGWKESRLKPFEDIGKNGPNKGFTYEITII